jgi:hypothetical protein
VEIWGEAEAAAFAAQGVGFSEDLSTGGLDPGAGVGARISFRWHGVSPWIGAMASGWLGSHRLHVNGVSDTQALPQAELLFGVGATFGSL